MYYGEIETFGESEMLSKIKKEMSGHHKDVIRIPKKLLYGVFGDYGHTLRAFKIEKVYMAENSVWFRANIAGVGRAFFSEGGGHYYYDSKDDYACKKHREVWDTDKEKELDLWSYAGEYGTLFQNTSIWGNPLYMRRYAWIDNRVKSIESKFYVSFDVETRKVDVVFFDSPEYKYASEDECKKDNEIDVCDTFIEDDDCGEVLTESLNATESLVWDAIHSLERATAKDGTKHSAIVKAYDKLNEVVRIINEDN